MASLTANVNMALCDERNRNLGELHKRNEARVDKHGQEIDDIRELTREMAAMNKSLREKIEQHDNEIRELLAKPGKRWELVATGLISTITAMSGAAIISMIVK